MTKASPAHIEKSTAVAVSRLLLLLWLCLGPLACSRSVVRVLTLGAYPKPEYSVFPSWEPTASAVPAVSNRELARTYLRQSRLIWQYIKLTRHRPFGDLDLEKLQAELQQHSGPPPKLDYVYFRAFERSGEEVQFTVLVVEQDRVVRRSFASDDPQKMAIHRTGDAHLPRLEWEERATDIGSHVDGAPPLTIDALYEQCEKRVLDAHPELNVHLYFHMDGVLQHCGFLADECRDCGSVSIQHYSMEREHGGSIPSEHQTARDFTCADQVGFYTAFENSAMDSLCMCEQAVRDRQASSKQDRICDIDPEACPRMDRPRADWACMTLLHAKPDMPQARYFWPEDLGRPSPLGRYARRHEPSERIRIRD